MADPRARIAALLLPAVALLFAWWAWKQGAYFGSVFYPGAIVAFCLLALLLFAVPFDGRLRGPVGVALAALGALAAWTLLSGLWSDAPAAAIKYAAHDFLYVAMFVLGLWLTNLLRKRMLYALAPLALAGALVGVGVVVVLATGTDIPWYLHGDATLRFPIGYRNANAAFLMMCFWPCLVLACKSDLHWALRAGSIAVGTILVELVLLAQSRGSMPAIAVSLVVLFLLIPHRVRAAAILGLILLPALPAIPLLLDVYRQGDTGSTLVPTLHTAAKAMALTAALSFVVAAFSLRSVEPRIRLSPMAMRRMGAAAAMAAILAVLVGGSVFVLRHGGPIGFVDQRITEFRRVGYPDLSDQGIRYGANVGSNRHDFWRVATGEGLDHPLLGGGAGSFQAAYLEHRRSGESPEDPHSVEALVFSELGFPGLLLLVAFVMTAALAGLRAWRLGPAAAALVAGSLAAAAQWFVQASFDWLWNYPGVTAPAMFLLGAAAAPALFDPWAGWAGRARAFGVAALVGLALLAVPLFLAGRYTQRANEQAAANPRAAIADLERAADLNPLDAEPLLAKGVIESRLGEHDLTLASFREALDREPSNYAAHYFIARVQVGSDPDAARLALEKARELNPRDRAIKALERRLDRAGAD